MAAPDDSGAAAVHPMVPVPDALMTVLRETARSLVESSSSPTESGGTKNTAVVHLHAEDGTPQYQSVMGRILAQDVMAQDPYPPFDASIMDGYTVRCADLISGDDGKTRSSEWTHQIVGQIFAGDDVAVDASPSSTSTRTPQSIPDKPFDQIHDETGSKRTMHGKSALSKSTPYDERIAAQIGELQSDEQEAAKTALPPAAYVTTGAVIPLPYDAVVPVEDIAISPDGKYLRIDSDTRLYQPGKWIRKVGCDMAEGSVALSAGTVLQPPHIGILIQVGVNELVVREMPTIGVLSTGNEILPSHQHPTKDGKIPDVNRPIILSTLSSWDNCIPIDLGIVTDDDVDKLTCTIKAAIDRCDVVVTTGGISMGEKDIMEDVFVQKFGAKVHFGRIHMKPGKPTTFMTIQVPEKQRTCLVFCLPGNPVSGIVCSHLFVRPCLDMLVRGVDTSMSLDEMVQDATVQEEIVATITKDVKLDVERPEYRRVNLTYVPSSSSSATTGVKGGRFLATSTGVQRSSRLMSMNGADGLMLLPKGEPGGKMVAKAGEAYPVMLLGGGIGTAGVKVRDSIHVGQSRDMRLSVGVIHIVGGENAAPNNDLAQRVRGAIGSDRFRVASTTTMAAGEGQAGVLDALMSPSMKSSDVAVVVCSDTPYHTNLDFAAAIRTILDKEADAMALQARKGAAEQHPTAALFEFTAGFVNHDGMQLMLLLLPDVGLDRALAKIGGLLPHGLKIGRGTTRSHGHHDHNHRHEHKHASAGNGAGVHHSAKTLATGSF